MFGFIKNTLKKLYTQLSSGLSALFGKTSIDTASLEELERLLLAADTGVSTTKHIINQLKEEWSQGRVTTGTSLHHALEKILLNILNQHTLESTAIPSAGVILLVGINGSGKTTFAGKLAHQLQHNYNKKVLLVAADTFRAAATNQLSLIAHSLKVNILEGTDGQDPSSLVFSGCQKYAQKECDVLIVDTAGRLQNKEHLMRELEKIRRVIGRQLPNTSIVTLLTIDSMLGQNSFEQARLFAQATQVNGIILTKMDGTAKGGIVFSIVNELHIPIAYMSYGESLQDCKPFNNAEFVKDLLSA